MLIKKVSAVFDAEPAMTETDPDFMIYSGGFFSDSDRSLMQTLRSTSPRDLGRLDLPFRDKRLGAMLLRYRGRNFPESLNPEELQNWQKFCHARVSEPAALTSFEMALTEAREQAREQGKAQGLAVLDAVEQYAIDLRKTTASAT